MFVAHFAVGSTVPRITKKHRHCFFVQFGFSTMSQSLEVPLYFFLFLSLLILGTPLIEDSVVDNEVIAMFIWVRLYFFLILFYF